MRALLVWTLALLSTAPAIAAPPQPQWTQFRQNPSHDPAIYRGLLASWRVETHAGFSASPTLVGDTLYIGNNAGRFYAIDVRTGRTHWTYDAESPLMSNPLFWHGLVIVGEGDQTSYAGDEHHALMVGKSENALLALDAATGALRWKTPLQGTGMPTPAIAGDTLFHHNGAGRLVALDPATGNVKYVRDLQSVASMSSILPIDNERVVTAGIGDNAVVAVNRNDGSIAWRYAFAENASGIGDCPLAGDDRFAYCNYVMPPDGERDVQIGHDAVQRAYAVDLSSGAIAWDVAYAWGTVPMWNEAAIPTVVESAIYVGSSLAPAVFALDAENGRTLWQTPVHGVVKGAIVEQRGVLYCGDLGGYLWALDARTGRVIGSKNMHVPFNVGSPLIVGRTLIVGSNSGALLAVPLIQIRTAHDP